MLVVAVALIVHFGVGSDNQKVRIGAVVALVVLGGTALGLVLEPRPRRASASTDDPRVETAASAVLRRYTLPKSMHEATPEEQTQAQALVDPVVRPATRSLPGATEASRDLLTGTTHPVPRVDAETPASDARAADVVPAATPLDPDALIAAWVHYRDHGDGHFTATGFQDVLDALGLEARVQDGATLEAADNVLVVVPSAEGGRCHVVPNFTKSRKAVSAWFEDAAGGALGGRVRNLLRLAEGNFPGEGGTPDAGEVRKGRVS